MILDTRLRAAANMVPQGARLADIGSDHAYLPIALCLENKIKYALASDINEGPVAAAVANIHKNGLAHRIEAVRADGLDKTKDFSPLVNSSRLSFAEEDDMVKYLDVTPGSVSIMGLINDKECKVQLAIDKDVLKPDFIGCHPCINTSSLKIKTSDLLEKYLPATKHTPILVEL